MMKGKALRRALQTADAYRVNTDVPKIIDTTELITPDRAYELLVQNTRNRPINWRKVEEYAQAMRAGQWRLHGQGILLDGAGNLLTGQKRLWAVIYSNTAVHMRISRGNPSDVAALIDRGDPQTARDLATRHSGRKHRAAEASIARAICALRGTVRPSPDTIAGVIAEHSDRFTGLWADTAGTKKTHAVLMILGAICALRPQDGPQLVKHLVLLSVELETRLAPSTARQCWGRGTAFALAMDRAREIVTTTVIAQGPRA